MSKEKVDYLQCEGIVKSARGNGNFLVYIPDMNIDVSCCLSGKIKKNTIRIIDGDMVAVDVSAYDMSKGRITYRFKGN
jgi:translation initiation factor IF-1